MKHTFVWICVAAAASGAVLAVACSSSSDSGGTPAAVDSGSDTGTSGTAQSSSGTSGSSGTQPTVDTCTSSTTSNTCQCSCGITGQTEDLSLHCPQPAADTGQCTKVCCTGPITDSGASSSGTSGNTDDSGLTDAADQ